MKLQNFKVKSENNDEFELIHPSGETMKIVKKDLSPKAHEMINKFCYGGMAKGGKVQKFDDGGGVMPITQPGYIADPNNPGAAIPDPNYIPPGTTINAAQAVNQAPPSSMPPQAGNQPAPASANAQAAPNDPLVQNRMDTNDLLNQQETGIKNYMKSSAGAAGMEQQAYQDFINKQAQMQSPQQIADSYKAKDAQFMQNILDTKVDPNRYFKDQSTGASILSAIGIVLGGAGGRGQGNQALDQLNKNVNQDIESQKNDQSQAMNLWKMNRENMQSDLQANLATQNQLLTGVQAKAAMAGAASKGAEAQFRSTQLINQIEQQKAQNRLHLGLLTQGATSGAPLSQANPLNLVNDFVPEAQRQKATDEIGKAQAASQNGDKLLSLFDDAAKQTRPATGRSMTSLLNTFPGYTAPAIESMDTLGVPLLKEQDGRVNEIAFKTWKDNQPHWGDSDARVAEKRNALDAFIKMNMQAPTAMANGINTENFMSTSSNPAAHLTGNALTYYNWAKANPSNPKAQAVLEKLKVGK